LIYWIKIDIYWFFLAFLLICFDNRLY
jgi:hypothetical protein